MPIKGKFFVGVILLTGVTMFFVENAIGNFFVGLLGLAAAFLVLGMPDDDSRNK
jgi:hypothetical protein